MCKVHICHGWDGVGVGVKGCCSILGLEPGVDLTLMNNFFNGFVDIRPEDTSMCEQLGFVIPWWKWCSWCSIISLSEGGTMRASPWRTRPSLMVRVSQCCQ